MATRALEEEASVNTDSIAAPLEHGQQSQTASQPPAFHRETRINGNINGSAPHLDALTFDFSTFNGKQDNAPKPQSLNWAGVCALLSQRRQTKSTSDAAKDGALLSGASYANGTTRGNENVLAVSLAILDFDDGTPLEAIEWGAFRLNNGGGAAAFIYSTFSHDPENGALKYRLVLPLAAPVVGADWPEVWQRLALHFDGKPDRAAKDAARMHYLPSCPQNRAGDAVAVLHPGAPLDVARLPPLPLQTAPVAPFEAPQGLQASGDPYALKAFQNEVARVCMAAPGTRNKTLNAAALAIGHFAGAGRLMRAEVEAALENAARGIGLPEVEARKTIKSGLDAGEREPSYKGLPITPERAARSVQHLQAEPITTPERAQDIPPPSLRTERGAAEYEAGQLVNILRPAWTCAALSTHAAHAARIFENIGGDLRFSAHLGWLTFNGRHWQRDDRHATQTADRAKELSQTVRSEGAALYHLAGVLAQEGRASDAEAMSRAAAVHIRHAKQVEAKAFVEGALHFAAGNPQTRVSPDAFDQRPWLLGFQNGVWDQGVWREHRREDFLLHLCPVAFDRDADQSEWQSVLDCMTGGDNDFKRTLQDAAGYILSGASHLRFLPWLYGPKGTGKSTFAELLQTTLGKMAATIDPKKLQDDAARERLGADLWNRRLAVCAEAGSQRLEAELLKTLSGSDVLTVRFLYQEAFDALPRHVLLMVANDAPRLDAYDDALKDRVVALPFVHSLMENGPLKLTGGARIEAVRKDPASPLVRGFAAWALEGLANVFKTQSIFRAPCIEAATAKFWADTDPITPFWETVDENELCAGISKNDLRKRYEAWCEAEGARPFNRNQWARACESFGLQEEQRGENRARFWFLSVKRTQRTQLRQFPESPREKEKSTHGLSGNEQSYVLCVQNGETGHLERGEI